MSPLSKITWSIIILLVAIGGLASQFITVRQPFVEPSLYTANVGELVQGSIVGQNFTAPADDLSGVGVMFATYSGRKNTEPVFFHLRESIYSQQDIRTVTVHPSRLGDNQVYQFTFEPIRDSAGKQFFFFVESPTSSPGNAVTVDINTQDPYHLGTAYIVSGQPAPTDPTILERSGKQTVDVVFGTYHTVPLRVAVVTKVTGAIRTFINTWDQQQHAYTIWGKALVPAVLFLVIMWLMRQSVYTALVSRIGKGMFTTILLTTLLVIGVGLRIMYAVELPITNDEGNYLYDARSLRQGILAGGDGYVKAPLFIAWVALWQVIFDDTILAGRLSSIVIGALTLFPLYFLAKELWSSKGITKAWLPTFLMKSSVIKLSEQAGWGRRVGIVTAAVWALFGAGIVFNIYVHTQPIALFFGISGLAVLLMALRGTTPPLTFTTARTAPSATGWFVLAGILLGLGVASRKSILALGLVPILLILIEGKSISLRIKHFFAVGFGFLLIIAAFVAVAVNLYPCEDRLFLLNRSGPGCIAIEEALGLNSAEDGLSELEPAELENVRSYSLRGMTPFFRESLPLILLSLVGFGMAAEQFIRSVMQRVVRSFALRNHFAFQYIMPRLGWLAAWAVFGWAWNFFFEYEGSVFWRYGILELWYVFGGVLTLMILMPPLDKIKLRAVDAQHQVVPESQQPGRLGSQTQDIADRQEEKLSVRLHLAALLLAPLWILGLVIFYTNWIKFHANYISEFIPPLVLLSGYGALALFQRFKGRLFLGTSYPVLELVRRVFIGTVVVILLWSITVSNYITFLFEHTGTFNQGALLEAAAWAQENIPREEPIFTGAAAVPYLSGHHTVLDIAHPRWYAYEFTRKDPRRLNAFLPPAEEMVQAYREAEWFLLESQTGFSFLMEYSEIEAGLERDWQQVHGIENGSNTLTFYRRIR